MLLVWGLQHQTQVQAVVLCAKAKANTGRRVAWHSQESRNSNTPSQGCLDCCSTAVSTVLSPASLLDLSLEPDCQPGFLILCGIVQVAVQVHKHPQV
jgi:hypothetical protein